MKFRVIKIKQAEKELNALSKEQQQSVLADYNVIENKGLEYVKRRFLRDGLFEIKTNDVRSLFKYSVDGDIILIGLIYEKRSNKAPEYNIKLALKRLKEV